jgi:glutamate synthase (NADPH) small chain
MADPKGFLGTPRRTAGRRPVDVRIGDWREVYTEFGPGEVSAQAGRCMDCGIPFCHSGCPLGNLIPEWNDLVCTGDWRAAAERLHATNNFPEFTGRLCPAPCESACVLGIGADPVSIKQVEVAIIDRAWAEGWVPPRRPSPAAVATGRRVAVVGSGPAGLACAQQLARAGHAVVVFEKRDRIGGLLRYGIPDFKMEKHLIDQRMAQMQAEGVEFRPNSRVGGNVPAQKLVDEYDAVVLAGGAEQPRDLTVEGRGLGGIHYAMDFLTQQNARVAGRHVADEHAILATGKNVVVIGGGDTGSDCVGTSIRQGATSVTQLEIMPRPPEREDKALTWPLWPMKLRTSTSHEEGCERDWAVSTRRALGNGAIEALELVRVEWVKDGKGGWRLEERNDSAFTIPADLVLLAMGFVHPTHDALLLETGVALDGRGNVKADTEAEPGAYQTNIAKVFAAGDMRRGQSLVVWAIREGRQAARSVDQFLMGHSELPR